MIGNQWISQSVKKPPLHTFYLGGKSVNESVDRLGSHLQSGSCSLPSVPYSIYAICLLNQLEAPEYHVEDMKTPTALFSGSNDKLASPTDVRLLKDRITNLKYFKEIQGWNHADFLFGNNAPELLYSKLINMMETDLTLGTELAEFELFDENWAGWTEI